MSECWFRPSEAPAHTDQKKTNWLIGRLAWFSMAWPGLTWPGLWDCTLTYFLNILAVRCTQVVYSLTYILLASILMETRQLSVKHDRASWWSSRLCQLWMLNAASVLSVLWGVSERQNQTWRAHHVEVFKSYPLFDCSFNQKTAFFNAVTEGFYPPPLTLKTHCGIIGHRDRSHENKQNNVATACSRNAPLPAWNMLFK